MSTVPVLRASGASETLRLEDVRLIDGRAGDDRAGSGSRNSSRSRDRSESGFLPGPQDGERQDRQIESRIQAELAASPYRAVRRVQCRFEEGVLTLQGKMPSYYCVQVAISIVKRHVQNGAVIQNHLQVVHGNS